MAHDQSRRARGRWGENLAAAHLRRAGFDVVERNWSIRHARLRGELDIIARRDDLVVFCEVKARRTSVYGGAAAAVDDRKQARIRALAAEWLRRSTWSDVDGRFDVIASDGSTLTLLDAAF
jgi:putative endonuclease